MLENQTDSLALRTMNHDSLLSSYDYELPEEFIARVPAPQRSDSRLLVLHRSTGEIEHTKFTALPTYLNPGDALVVNESKVVPARLLGQRQATGGKWEGLFLREQISGVAGVDQREPPEPQTPLWEILSQTRGKLQQGEVIEVHPIHQPESTTTLELKLLEKQDEGKWLVQPISRTPTFELLDHFGTLPLPPYIQRQIATADDEERYQTVYSQTPGSVAAPTAGLHFTPELLDQCQMMGVELLRVRLHVGIGTFRPIAVENIEQHNMHSEYCEIDAATVTAIQRIKQTGGRIIAVGTTSVRTLESAARMTPPRPSGERDGVRGMNRKFERISPDDFSLQPFRGETNLFIRPGFNFQIVDALITNFHLPKSSLLVLVSTFANREQILKAYEAAKQEHYRFFSYGDAMLIV